MKAVLDIGKTHVKLQLVKESGEACDAWSKKNAPVAGAHYPHADITGIWRWLGKTLRDSAQANKINALVVTTHGATAALVDAASKHSTNEDGLVLPVVDYEFTGVADCEDAYRDVRPHFNETLSPALPAGLNLGRQLFWLQQNFPADFSRATHILMYPQYWGWRFTGAVAGEVTSLGCHTDLWSPHAQSYSSLVQQCHWQTLMPPLKSAWQILGKVSEEVALETGLLPNCDVYVGLHDSNASYLRYLLNHSGESFTVVSTGTWTILMHARAQLTTLDSARDMLANCDIYGAPVACARFMGGREYSLICERLGCDVAAAISSDDMQIVLDNLWMVTPDFSDGNGPFGGLKPTLDCPVPSPCGAAIATVYCALMIDQRLNDLQATGPVFIEGAFLKNPLLCQLVAQLRDEQPIYLSADDTGTVQGAVLLTKLPKNENFTLAAERCNAAHFTGLEEYRTRWYSAIREMQSN